MHNVTHEPDADAVNMWEVDLAVLTQEAKDLLFVAELGRECLCEDFLRLVGLDHFDVHVDTDVFNYSLQVQWQNQKRGFYYDQNFTKR